MILTWQLLTIVTTHCIWFFVLCATCCMFEDHFLILYIKKVLSASTVLDIFYLFYNIYCISRGIFASNMHVSESYYSSSSSKRIVNSTQFLFPYFRFHWCFLVQSVKTKPPHHHFICGYLIRMVRVFSLSFSLFFFPSAFPNHHSSHMAAVKNHLFIMHCFISIDDVDWEKNKNKEIKQKKKVQDRKLQKIQMNCIKWRVPFNIELLFIIRISPHHIEIVFTNE